MNLDNVFDKHAGQISGEGRGGELEQNSFVREFLKTGKNIESITQPDFPVD